LRLLQAWDFLDVLRVVGGCLWLQLQRAREAQYRELLQRVERKKKLDDAMQGLQTQRNLMVSIACFPLPIGEGWIVSVQTVTSESLAGEGQAQEGDG